MPKLMIALLTLISVSLFAGGTAPHVEFGEHLSTQTVFGGLPGVWMGNNADKRFYSGGQIVFSSKGGWVQGARNGEVPTHVSRSRQEILQPEFGEYQGQGTVFGGIRGYWAGTNADMRFFDLNHNIVFSSKGGWVKGMGAGYEVETSAPSEFQKPQHRIFKVFLAEGFNGGDPKASFTQVTEVTEVDRIYLVVDDTARRRFLTRSIATNGKAVLEMRALNVGTVVYGIMGNDVGAGSGYKYKLIQVDDKGMKWERYQDDPNNIISVKFEY